MRNSKKWIALASAVLFLGGCGATNEVQAPANNQVEPAETEQIAESEEFTKTDAGDSSTEIPPSETNEAPVSDSMPVISVREETKKWYLEDNTTLLLEVSASLVSVENGGFEDLKTALKENFSGVDKENYDYLAETAKEDYNFRDEELKEYFVGYTVDETAELARSDSSVVSLRTVYSDYTGGAHGMYAIGGQTFDVESGKLLELTDILTDAEGFYSKAVEYISEKVYEEYGDELFPEYKEYVAETFDTDRDIPWYLNAAGIVIAYSPYELGPYAMGAPEVLLPYGEFKDYINEKYIKVQDEMIARVPRNEDISLLIGESESIMLTTSINEWEMLSVNVASETSAEELGSFGGLENAYVLKRPDGRNFVIVVCDYMSDDYEAFAYEVTGGAIRKSGGLNGAYPSGDYMSTNRFEMFVRLDVLGSYWARMDYLFDEEGQLTQAEEIFTIDGVNAMTVMKDLPVTMDGADTTLGVGAQIIVTGTNNEDEVYFRVVDSEQTGTIRYTLDENDPWIHLIDGVSEYEYLEGLPYAG